MAIFSSIFGDKTQKLLRDYKTQVNAVNAFEKEFETLSDKDLQEKTGGLKKMLREGKTLEDILPQAFALVREAAKRTLLQRHYDVQILGGITLFNGNIAEMKTGEGKTLVATLPAYLRALSEKGVHLVTVNDYLARRDAVWMGQIYNLLGLSIGVINHEASYLYDGNVKNDEDTKRDQEGGYHIVYDFLRPSTRKEAYEADITYGTNSEFGFDYLRDNLAYATDRVAQRGHAFAIVDEVDSILIDEARTPLIISAPIGKNESLYPMFTKIAESLQKDTDYTVDEKQKAIQLTDSGIEKAEKSLNIDNIYTEKGIKYVHHLEIAVRAKALFEKDKDYVVKDGEVIIVDHFTGRLQPGRRWSEGLHQAIEAKEGVTIKEESRTFASVSYQNYFKMYEKLSGMTGTALTSAEEFVKVYELETISIPPNRETARIDHGDLIFQTEKGKFTAVAKRIKELNEAGRPVLVGTVSIERNELLSKMLTIEGVPHKVLNAKNHEQEGEIIANAGKKGGVTIATNMAGRGVDIKLGGAKATTEEYEEIKNLGGLYVLGTERHEARRIDNQLRGRSGRQGDPGETQFFISLEDTLMRIFAPERIKNMMGRFGIPEDEPIKNNLISKAIESAQSKIEGLNFDARKHLLEFDDVLNHQRKIIYGRRRKILDGKKENLNEILENIIDSLQYSLEAKEKVEERKAVLGDETFWNIFRIISLQSLDMLWVDHLEIMDYMRGSVNLRAYGQRDPLVEYKKEGLKLFKELEEAIAVNILHILPHIGKIEQRGGETEMKDIEEKANLITNIPQTSLNIHEKQEKVGRNDPCPCGSGKKYKKCHMNSNS